VGVLNAAAAIRKLHHTILTLVNPNTFAPESACHFHISPSPASLCLWCTASALWPAARSVYYNIIYAYKARAGAGGRDSRTSPASTELPPDCPLAFTQYCHYQYSMVYIIQKEGRGRGRTLQGSRVILLQQRGPLGRGNTMVIGSFTKTSN